MNSQPSSSPAAPLSRFMDRRGFLRTSALTSSGLYLVTSKTAVAQQTAPGRTIKCALVGCGAQGNALRVASKDVPGIQWVAMCDIWKFSIAKTRGGFLGENKHQVEGEIKIYEDINEMLDKEPSIEAVFIATPDFLHAPYSRLCLEKGKHVYCEKPLAHSIEETRIMARVAAETKVVTQMGNTGHASEGLRLTKEWIDVGAIGAVSEVHVWSDRPGKFWDSQGKPRPTEKLPVPATLDWNQWQGAAPEHDYHPLYVPRKWRGWFDYGCGALGDMMVHNADPAWYALDLGAPTSVDCRACFSLMSDRSRAPAVKPVASNRRPRRDSASTALTGGVS